MWCAVFGVLAAGAQSPAVLRTLPQAQEALGFTDYSWDGDSVCFSNASHVVQFYQGRRRAEVNGTVVYLNAAPDGHVKNGEWRMAAMDLDFLSLSILPKDCNVIKPLRVMVDAGHGGMDDGAISRTPAVPEKTLTLDLARRIGKLLEAAGMQVVYTRTNDVAVALETRARMARKEAADVFVSVHANFASNTNACGPETYVLTPAGFPGTPENSKARGVQAGNTNDFHNTLLGYSIHKHLVQVDPDVLDRGLKRQAFFVLREVPCPSVLVEVGFLSNEAEATKMLTDEWKDPCALAIARGVIEYARKADALTLALDERRQREARAREQAAKAKAEAAQKQAEEERKKAEVEQKKAEEARAEAERKQAEAERKKAEEAAKPEAPVKPEEPVKQDEPAKPEEPVKQDEGVQPVKPEPAAELPPPQAPHPEDPQTVFDFYLNR